MTVDPPREKSGLPAGVEGLAFLLAVATNFRSIPTRLDSTLTFLSPLAANARLFVYEGERQTLRIDPIHATLSTLLVLCALAYFLLDALLLLRRHPLAAARAKWGLVFTATTILLALPIIHFAIARHASGDPALFAHDGGVVATEVAADLVLSGRNPYAASFHGTPLERHVYGSRNPILEHYPYPPGNFLLAIVLAPPARLLIGWYDQRLVTLLSAVLLLVVLATRSGCGARARLLALVLLLNPVSLSWAIEGDNDLPFVVLVALSAFLIQGGSRRSGLATLGIACCMKQFAWLFAPYFLIAARNRPPSHADGAAAKDLGLTARALWLLSPAIVLIVPFLAWDPIAFLTDTVRYHAGDVPNPYPLGGTPGRGLSNLILALGLVRNNTDGFPLGVFHLFVSLPIGSALLLRLARGDRRASEALRASAILALAVAFCSRSLQENYLGVIGSLLAAGILLEGTERVPSQCPGTGVSLHTVT